MYKLVPILLMVCGISCVKKGVEVEEKYKKGIILRTKFIPGEKWKYQQETINTFTVASPFGVLGTTEMFSNWETIIQVEDTVEEVDIKITFKNVETTMKIGETLKRGEMLERLENKSIYVKLSKEGSILEVKGGEIFNECRERGGCALFYSQKEKGNPFSSCGWTEWSRFLPTKRVKIGEEWEVTTEGIKSIYRLIGIEKRMGVVCAKIKGKHKINQMIDPGEIQGMRVKTTFRGEGEEEIYVNVEDGKIMETKMTTSIQGETKTKLGEMLFYLEEERKMKITPSF
jgi:hypothetical protein